MENNLVVQINLLLKELQPVKIKQERLKEIQSFSLEIARKLDEEKGTNNLIESKVETTYKAVIKCPRRAIHKSLLYLQSILQDS